MNKHSGREVFEFNQDGSLGGNDSASAGNEALSKVYLILKLVGFIINNIKVQLFSYLKLYLSMFWIIVCVNDIKCCLNGLIKNTDN